MYEDIYKRIIDECTFRNLSKGTIKQYVYHVSCLLKWLGDKPADEITTNDIKEYVLFKRGSSCSPATCNGILSALSFFYRVILKKTWDYDELHRMKVDRTLPAVCSFEEIEKLIDTVDNIDTGVSPFGLKVQ